MTDPNITPDPIHMMAEIVLPMVNLADDGITPLAVGEPGKSEVQLVVMLPEIVCEMINAPLPPDRSR